MHESSSATLADIVSRQPATPCAGDIGRTNTLCFPQGPWLICRWANCIMKSMQMEVFQRGVRNKCRKPGFHTFKPLHHLLMFFSELSSMLSACHCRSVHICNDWTRHFWAFGCKWFKKLKEIRKCFFVYILYIQRESRTAWCNLHANWLYNCQKLLRRVLSLWYIFCLDYWLKTIMNTATVNSIIQLLTRDEVNIVFLCIWGSNIDWIHIYILGLKWFF